MLRREKTAGVAGVGSEDRYNLERFVQAQDGVFDEACAELRRGRKVGHWMWFIFPQFAGLGSSGTSRKFAIASLEEARAYLAHPVLGARLREVCRLVGLLKGQSMSDVFGYPDDLKLRSSMTLFAHATAENDLFVEIIREFFGGEFDRRTLELMELP